MSDLISKVSASGLSAGVFLLWWPAHVPSQGGDVLLVRGVLWALAFEILLVGFRPLERAVGRAVRTREAGALAPRRIAPLLAIAAVAAAVPATMLCGARAPIAAPARAAAPKVIVKREIVRREVVVRRVSHVVRVPVASAAATPAPAAARPTVAAKPATTTVRRKSAASAPLVTSGATSDTKADLPDSTTTTVTPTPTATTTAPTPPAVTTAPATSAAATPAAATAKTAGG